MARTRIASEGLTVGAYGDRIGWDIAPALATPEHVWQYPFDMLHAICDDLGVDWKEFIDGHGWPR